MFVSFSICDIDSIPKCCISSLCCACCPIEIDSSCASSTFLLFLHFSFESDRLRRSNFDIECIYCRADAINSSTIELFCSSLTSSDSHALLCISDSIWTFEAYLTVNSSSSSTIISDRNIWQVTCFLDICHS